MPDEPQPTALPATPAHPDFARPPAAAGENRQSNIWVPPDVWAQMQQRDVEYQKREVEHQKMLEAKENERLKAMAEKGQIEQAFTESNAAHDRKYAELKTQKDQREQAWLDERRTQTINEAISGLIFVGQDDAARSRTAAMVRRLLELDIEAVIGPTGAPMVRDRKTMQPATEYLRARLTAPDSEFAALLAPNARGGSGTDGTRPPANPTTAPPPKLTVDETVKLWQASQQSPGIGLSPIRKSQG
jgi:hypothetical protein